MRARARVWWAILGITVWVVGMGLGGPFFGLLPEVQSQEASDFLPASAESTRALELQRAFSDDTAPPAVVLVTGDDGIAYDAQTLVQARLQRLPELPGVGAVSPSIASNERTADGRPLALQAFVRLDGAAAETVTAIRAELAGLPVGVTAYVTGPAGFLADLVSAFGAIDGILLIVTVAAVLVILLAVYRSPVLPIVVLLSSIAALSVSVVVVYLMARSELITLNGQAQGILFILVIGAATDYGILLVSRFREALLDHQEVSVAIRRAWRAALEPILASGGTVVAGVLCLLLSGLNSNKALGPVAAAGIVVAMLASLTFLPAILALLGRFAYFPAVPQATSAALGAMRTTAGGWARLAALVARRPRATWMATAVVLIVAAAFAPNFRADGVAQSEIVLGATESAAGQRLQARYFAAGSGAPTIVIGDEGSVESARSLLELVPGVDSVRVRAAGFAGPAAAQPLVASVDGRSLVELQVTLVHPADSPEALAVVEAIRASIRSAALDAVVGGPTATALDTRTTARRDLLLIIPSVLVVITVMLMLLLRAVVAPLILVATTAMSFLSTLGIASLVFDHVFDFPGADPTVPLFGFVFLVALGIDYNIFLTSRIREETPSLGTRRGVVAGLRVTGGVITSAGIVLAATFAALAVIPLLFLAQLAFIVAFGVLVDALVVRSLLVPGLLYDLGARSWWPSRLGRADGHGRRRPRLVPLPVRAVDDLRPGA